MQDDQIESTQKETLHSIWSPRAVRTLSFALWYTVLIVLAAGAETKLGFPPPNQVFAKDAFWYATIPIDAPLHRDSEQFVQEFLRQKKSYFGTVSINTRKYASPIYVATASTPKLKVHQWDCQKKGYLDQGLAEQWQAVPIPEHAEPADGSDAEMTVYSSAEDTLWEFWVTRKGQVGWEACWGGQIQAVSANKGIWPFPYGTTATGLPFIGGQLTVQELLNERIEHVIGISLVDTENASVVSWPANRSDGDNPQRQPFRIPEGLRFRLDPTVDVEALNMHPVGKVIARAAQTYGFVVWDKAGSITLRAENPKAWTSRGLPDPYRLIFKGTPAYAILNGFPWDRLQFFPQDFGKPQ